jgi:hypothetical protein
MPPGHEGQSSTPPQPFPIRPQYWPPPIGLQVIAVQLVGAHTPGTPPAPHVIWTLPAAQSPHASVPPQPSPMVPQYCVVADLHVSGTHPAFTQTPAVQTSPVAHAPQSSFVPQPSPIVPQYLAPPPDAQVIRWQLAPPTQMLDMQTLSPEQVPHSSAPPLQPLPILPQYWPPAGVQVTDGVHAASLPASTPIVIEPPVPVVGAVPAAPVVPPRPAIAPVPPVAPPLPGVDCGITFATHPSDAASATASTRGPPDRRIRTIRGLPAGAKTARIRRANVANRPLLGGARVS